MSKATTKKTNDEFKRYDLHIHSSYSPCSTIKPIDILKLSRNVGLNGIAITDHNTMKAAKMLEKINKDENLEIILGEEVKTNHGDILGLYIQEELKKRELFDVIDEIKAQDGIIIIPHPFRLVPWLKFDYPLAKLTKKIDAVETFNSRNFNSSNMIADNEATRLNFAKVGSSDAHMPFDIGKGFTLFKGDLRKATKEKKTIADGSTKLGLISASLSSIHKRVIHPLKVHK